MLTTLTIAGGVALLLFAVRYLRKGLDRLFGPKLEDGMRRMSRTPFRSMLAGLLTSILAPSSTTMSLLAVQAVQAGHLSARRTLLVMLGANVGLTLTIQLISLHIDQYAPLLLLVGVILFQFTSRSITRGIGQVCLAIGFLFIAVGIMRDAVIAADLNNNADFMQLIELASRYPLPLLMMAALLTMVVQSSTTTIALMIGMASTGTLPMSVVVTIILGANVGMAVTTMIVSWRHIESRRLGVANLLLKGTTACVPFLIIVVFGSKLPEPDPDLIGMWVAQMHTGFNVLVALVGLPLANHLTMAVERMLPIEPTEQHQKFGPKFIDDGPIGSVAIALGQSLREIMHVSEIVRSMLVDMWTALRDGDEQLANRISERDDLVDLLEMRIKVFLTRVVREECSKEDAEEQLRQLRYISELETIGDIIDKNLVELVLKRIRLDARFSDEGWRELEEFHLKIVENFNIADTAFTTRDETLSHQLLRHKDRINRLEEQLRDRHFHRLNDQLAESHETSAIHLDLLTHMKRINSSLCHVAYSIVGYQRQRSTDRL